MPVISDTITATTGIAVAVTSADPVVDVTQTGGILAVDAAGDLPRDISSIWN